MCHILGLILYMHWEAYGSVLFAHTHNSVKYVRVCEKFIYGLYTTIYTHVFSFDTSLLFLSLFLSLDFDVSIAHTRRTVHVQWVRERDHVHYTLIEYNVYNCQNILDFFSSPSSANLLRFSEWIEVKCQWVIQNTDKWLHYKIFVCDWVYVITSVTCCVTNKNLDVLNTFEFGGVFLFWFVWTHVCEYAVRQNDIEN